MNNAVQAMMWYVFSNRMTLWDTFLLPVTTRSVPLGLFSMDHLGNQLTLAPLHCRIYWREKLRPSRSGGRAHKTRQKQYVHSLSHGFLINAMLISGYHRIIYGWRHYLCYYISSLAVSTLCKSAKRRCRGRAVWKGAHLKGSKVSGWSSIPLLQLKYVYNNTNHFHSSDKISSYVNQITTLLSRLNFDPPSTDWLPNHNWRAARPNIWLMQNNKVHH